MRYGPEHKAEVHQKIVKDASRRVRAEGLNGAAVAAVMRDTGLTHGGFYKHFPSKNGLLLESLREAFRDIIETLAGVAEQSHPEAPWKAIVKTYLSPEYCDHIERGCPAAGSRSRVGARRQGDAASDICRAPELQESHGAVHAGRRAADKDRAFFVIFSTMIGAVEIARILPDREAQEKVLASARDFLLCSF